MYLKSNLTLIEPSCRNVYFTAKTFPRSRRFPDLLDWPACEEIVDGYEDIRDYQSGDCAPDDPQINLLRGYEAKEEKTDGESDEEYREEVGWLSGPQPHEGLRDLIRLQIIHMPS